MIQAGNQELSSRQIVLTDGQFPINNLRIVIYHIFVKMRKNCEGSVQKCFRQFFGGPPFLRPERSAEGGLQRILNAPQKNCSTWAEAHCQTPVLYNYGHFWSQKKVGKIWVIFEMLKNQAKFRHFF